METVSWSTIEAECGHFRDGFVQTFKKYEDRLTDEVDTQGRQVYVTASSFARHANVPYTTFRDWVTRYETSGTAAAPSLRERDRAREAIDRMPVAERAALAAELIETLPEDERTEAVAHVMRSEGLDFMDAVDAAHGYSGGYLPDPPEISTADRKAAEASARQRTSPIYRGFAKTELALAVEAFREVVDAVRNAVANDAIDSEVVKELDAVHDEYVLARQEVDFKLGVS